MSALVVGSLFGSGLAGAQGEEAAIEEAKAALAADPENGVRALKAGETAQGRRWESRMHELDPDTRARLNGQGDEAQLLRERGHRARHTRQDLKRREMFNDMLEGDLAGNSSVSDTARARRDVERLGHRPADLDRLQRSGERALERRAHRAHGVSDMTQGQAPEAAELQHRGEVARHHRGVRSANATRGIASDVPRSAPRTHARANAGSPRARVGAGSLAKGVAGGMAVGWAAETALGVHVPDPLEAAQWTGDTLARPENLPNRVGELGVGATQLAVQAAKQLARPDQMAVNLANGTVGLAKSGAHMVTHPDEAAAAVGNTVVGVGRTVVGVGTGLGRGAVAVAKAGGHMVTHPKQTVASVHRASVAVHRDLAAAARNPAKTVKKVGCSVDKIFKPGKKC